MRSSTQTRLLTEAPAAPARARRPRVRLLRGGRPRTLPMPLTLPEAPTIRAPEPLRDPPALRAVPNPPTLDPAMLLGAFAPAAGGPAAGGSGPISLRGDALRESMVGAEDVVMLQPGGTVTNGELAAVRLRGENWLALRRVYFENDQVRLQPENHRLAAIVVDRADVEIEGRVLAIARQAGW